MVEQSNLKLRNTPSRYVGCIGPVDDLERYIDPEWWMHIFDSIYLKTDGDVVNNQEITRMEVNLIIQALNLRPDCRILDLCCGHGRHSIELAKRGYAYVEGLDASSYLIDIARENAKREFLNIEFSVGDARRLPYSENYFDAVLILGNSFGYFECLDDDLAVLKEVHRVLKPYGKVLLDVTNGEYLRKSYEARSWEWIDREHVVCRERTLSKDGTRLICREIIINMHKGAMLDQFYAVRLYTYGDLKALLERAGFVNVKLHENLCIEAEKNRDVGMMGNRLIVSADARKEGKDGDS